MCNEIFLLDGIQNRARNLNYVSETDADVNVTIFGRDVQKLTTFNFALANHIGDDTTIETFPATQFFDNLDSAKGAAILREYLSTNLSPLWAFKVGDIRRDVYAVGLFNGYIVGVKSFAVET